MRQRKLKSFLLLFILLLVTLGIYCNQQNNFQSHYIKLLSRIEDNPSDTLMINMPLDAWLVRYDEAIQLKNLTVSALSEMYQTYIRDKDVKFMKKYPKVYIYHLKRQNIPN